MKESELRSLTQNNIFNRFEVNVTRYFNSEKNRETVFNTTQNWTIKRDTKLDYKKRYAIIRLFNLRFSIYSFVIENRIRNIHF